MTSKNGLLVAVAAITIFLATISALAYPPAVGILGKSPNCLSCHVDNGSWVDGPNLIIDVVDKKTGSSLKQPNGTFLVEAKRDQAIILLTIIGYAKADRNAAPYRNAWLYIDPNQIDSSSLTKFPLGWEVNLPMACRLVGDKSELYPDANLTILPMTIRPGKSAVNGVVNLQVMLTRGEAVKGNAKAGMVGNFFSRTLVLKILDDRGESTEPEGSNGRAAPAFVAKDLKGKTWALADLTNSKPVILWFTNFCEGCQAVIPRLDSLYAARILPNAELLAISLLGEDRQTIDAGKEKLSFRFPVLLDPDGKICRDFVGSYVPASCPAQNLFIVGSDGNIKYETHYPGSPLKDIVSALEGLAGETGN
jgi:peroxiredoxin